MDLLKKIILPCDYFFTEKYTMARFRISFLTKVSLISCFPDCDLYRATYRYEKKKKIQQVSWTESSMVATRKSLIFEIKAFITRVWGSSQKAADQFCCPSLLHDYPSHGHHGPALSHLYKEVQWEEHKELRRGYTWRPFCSLGIMVLTQISRPRFKQSKLSLLIPHN